MLNLLLIYNPKSGRGQIKQNLADIIDSFIKAGYIITIHSTQAREDAKDYVIKYGEKYRLIVCIGGDGTISEVVSGTMRLKEKPYIGYIPSGSTNDFAVGLGLPKKLLAAAEVVIKGKVFPIDIGSFNNKTFTYIAAFGAFTKVSYSTPQEKKRLLGHPAYIIESFKSLSSLKPHHLAIKNNDEVIEGDFIYGMVTNAVSVGGFKGLTGGKVVLDDGLFECTFVRAPKNGLDLQSIIGELLGINTKSDKIVEFKTSKLYIKSEENLPWVLDGEFGGSYNKVVIKNHKRAINMISN